MILRIALDAPLRRLFDYLPPAGELRRPAPGIRVRVPFGRREVIGILISTAADSEVSPAKLKRAAGYVDTEPVFDAITLELLVWAADYYHHPIGEVMATSLPTSLRQGQAAERVVDRWALTHAGELKVSAAHEWRAPRQRALLDWLRATPAAEATDLRQRFGAATLRVAIERGWVQRDAPSAPTAPAASTTAALPTTPALELPTLTDAQRDAVAAIEATLGTYAAHLLHGVTGSGKTEVYLRVIARAIDAGGQALVLVPEIALTPQLIERFEQRFGSGVAAFHSGLTATSRRDAWRAAHAGHARILIGTRSAVFTSLPHLALIVVDEEHDPSYKQHEGFRYSARDLAVRRAQRARVPVVLGSATPSLESLDNVEHGRYRRLSLPHRPGLAQAPRIALIDLRRHAVEQGLSTPALRAIEQHLAAGGQVIVFLNRRGYAPTLFCNACGWIAACEHCDARMTVHRGAQQLRCHHCGAHSPIPSECGRCKQALNPVGQGTERVEETLTRLFPQAPLARLDRDSAGARGALHAVLARVHSGEARILVGTQMLTKGHHFPEVSLVVILEADQGLFATDYRATERLAQTITQVAGRAGRAARPGEVLIQTEFPDHPLLVRLLAAGYEGFATAALAERRAAHWPPYSRLALLRAEARDSAALGRYLNAAVRLGLDTAPARLQILGPAPALMARRADHFRAHVLLEAPDRSTLQGFLPRWIARVEALKGPPGLRWSLDVDPIEVD